MRLGGGWINGGGRFLSGPMMISGFVAAGIVVSLGTFRVFGDGLVYLAFLRRALGYDEPLGVAYQFGTSYWNAPFYVAGSVIDRGELAIGVGSFVAASVMVYASWKLLEDLALPRGPLVIGAVFLGTPVWFYVVFEPSYTHSVDALVQTCAALALVRFASGQTVASAVRLGLWVGVLPTVRYANVMLVPWLLLPTLLLGTRRLTLVAAAAAATAFSLLVAIPLALGIPFGQPPAALTPRIVSGGSFSFDVLAPVKMLFTLHRGLFLWTPLTLIAVVGFLLMIARTRNRQTRTVLVCIGMGSLSTLAFYVVLGGSWDAGFSFSQRFLAGLFPLFLIGTAFLFSTYQRLAGTVIALCAAFSVAVGLTMFNGYPRQSSRDGVDHLVGLYFNGERSIPQLVATTGVRARERWRRLLP